MTKELYSILKAAFCTFVVLGTGLAIFALGIFLIRLAVGDV